MKVSVIGLGYVGSVVAAGLAWAGHQVLGVDVDRTKVDTLRRGQALFYEPGFSDLVEEGLQSGRLSFLHPKEVSEPLGGAIVIATGTPSTQTGRVDFDQVQSALTWVLERQPKGGVVIMKSTVLSLSQKSELVMGMSLGVPSKRHQLGRW